MRMQPQTDHGTTPGPPAERTPANEPWLSSSDIAALLGVSTRMVQKISNEGGLPYSLAGSRTRGYRWTSVLTALGVRLIPHHQDPVIPLIDRVSAAGYLGISLRSFDNLRDKDSLPQARVGDRVLCYTPDLDAWMHARQR